MTDLLCDAPVHSSAGACDAIAMHPAAIHPANDKVAPQTRLLIRIDRYLRAAGATNPALRGRLMAATARDLLARGMIAEPAWAEIVAAIDRSLAEELATEGKTLPRARGRVALGLAGAAAPASGPDLSGPDWGTPPRRASAMPAQDLSLWRPSAGWLLHLQLSRRAQGLAACLCWLAVLIVP
ncbi:MAG TPA: hypothetical protein VIS03_11570 [Kiloniellaceae bacterium]